MKHLNRYADLLLALIILVIYFKFISHGQFNFIDTDTLRCVFDDQANSLLQGRLDMNPEVLKWEAFHVNGKAYTYWGIWPALLRIPGLLFIPEMNCQWAKPSVFLASILFLWGIWANLRHALKGWSQNLIRFSVFIFSLGTCYLWLLSWPNVYHEVISWALVGSIWAIYFSFKILEISKVQSFNEIHKKYLIGLILAVALCLFTRPTYALPFFTFIFIYACLEILKIKDYFGRLEIFSKDVQNKRVEGILFFLVFSSIPLFVQLTINFLKWGNPLTFIDLTKSDLHMHDPRRMTTILEYGYLNWRRLPDTLTAYFGLGEGHFFNEFPFVRTQSYIPWKWNYFDGVEPTVSLTLTNFWLFILAGWGLISLFKNRYSVQYKFLAFLLAGLALTPFFFWAIIQRYVFEMFPVLLFLSFIGLRHLPPLKQVSSVKLALLGVLLFISLWSSYWCVL